MARLCPPRPNVPSLCVALRAHRQRVDRLAQQDGTMHGLRSREKSSMPGGGVAEFRRAPGRLRRPQRRVPELEVAALPDHHRVALESRVLAQTPRAAARARSRRQLRAPRSRGAGASTSSPADGSSETLPPARGRAPTRWPGSPTQPSGWAVSTSDFYQIEQRSAMARRDGGLGRCVERDDRRPVKLRPFGWLCHFFYVLPLYW